MDGEFFSRITRGAIVYDIKKPLANFRRQPVTKAAEKIKKWEELVKKEVEEEF